MRPLATVGVVAVVLVASFGGFVAAATTGAKTETGTPPVGPSGVAGLPVDATATDDGGLATASEPTAGAQGVPVLAFTAVSNRTLLPGETVVYRFALTNVGSGTAFDVGLWLKVDNATLFFGSGLNRDGRVGVFVPRLRPGERRVFELRVGVEAATLPGTYLVAGNATYRDQLGAVRRSGWLATGVTVGEANFSVGTTTAAG